MHHIYHTEGLILSSRNFGEAGKYYRIFTRDLGMITASAQGVRKIPSKLRFILSDFAYVKIDLVRGKDFWRVTSASKTNELESVSRNPLTLPIVANVSRLLARLLAGEEANAELFADLLRGYSMLEKGTSLYDVEAVIVLRVLSHLGYIGAEEHLARSPLEEELILEAAKKRKGILREINRALRETHL